MNAQFDVEQILNKMAADLRTSLAARAISSARMIGIHTGGVWVAQRLHDMLGLEQPLGTRIGMHPRVNPSNLPFDVDDQHIILVDDVLHTGRTIRAALNEVFDYGRPASVMLAVLVERSGRELPIEASVVGTCLALGPNEHVKLTGPEPLELRVQESP
ncbi:MAG: hypothetical protein AMJ69_07825 [Gammaproteobacteria bacterium SG8_47]|nr:MAG: hypothetical protein AMJ69_07825 [Gammaproteobacteria bacterium SG8_47]